MTIGIVFGLLSLLTHTHSFAQRSGEQAEMNRLEQQADDLASQNDPNGAALAIGKAAMMADHLMETSQESEIKTIFQSTSYLFRGQELGLRALALFEQTGGIPPAPAGVCHFLLQGKKGLNDSKNLLEKDPISISEEFKDRRESLLEKNVEWESLLQELHHEFECQGIQRES